MRQTTRETKRLCNSIKFRKRFSCLSLSLLLVAVFAASLFLLPRPSVASSSNDDAIVIDGTTVIIQGNTTTTDIRASMESDAGKNTDTVLFKNSITIQTLQTASSDAPFARATWLKYVKADEGAQVAFAPASGQTDPTLAYFFYNCSGLTSLDGLSAWDVSKVSGVRCMDSMFYGCAGLTSLDALSAWDVSKVSGVRCMQSMFRDCSSLTSLDGLSAWNVGNVTGNHCMYSMFYGCSGLTSLEGLSAWDVGNVTGDYCMYGMFEYCSAIASLDGLSAWDVSNVTGESCMESMFNGCSGLTSLDGLSAWNVGKVNGDSCMSYMFNDCRGLTSLEGLSAWDVSNVGSDYCMSYMFYNCSGLTSLDGLSAWDVSNVTGESCMESMFYGCRGLTSLDGLSAWDVSNVRGGFCMESMFANCTGLTSLDALKSWNIDDAIASSDGVKNMFSGCANIASITLGGAGGFKLNSTMSLPSANWWPVDAATPAAINTADLITQSTQVTPSSLRWQKCASGSTNPMKTVSNLTVVWPETNAGSRSLIYNGLFQTLGTKDNRVQVTASIDGDSVTLREGADFFVVYKDASGKDTVAIKDAGEYSARIVLRGAFTGSDSSTIDVCMKQLDLASDTYSLKAYTAPNRFAYTGSAHTPKTMVRLYLRDDSNPKDPSKDIPIYTYLIENTDTRKEGDYKVSYTNNINPGTATATVNPATPEGRAHSNLENSTNAYFAIGGYFVTFDSCGGTSVPEQGTTSGGKIKVPTQPSKQGFVFDGWYKENTYTTKWDFATDTVDQDITLYAKWANAVTVTFNSNGGSEVKPQTVVKDTVAKKPADPTREGYNFLYWCTDTELTTEFNFATPITADITLYAKWEVAPEPGPEPTPDPEPEPAPGTEDGWVESDAGWQYVLNGEFLNDGWHYFEDEYGNHWYYFDADTYMATSRWIWDDEYEGWYWVCSTGPMIENLWQWIDNAWYGFWWGGKMCQGWVWDTAYVAWYYCDDYTGRVACNEWAYDGAWYYFDQNCHMLTNCWVGDYWLNYHGMWV